MATVSSASTTSKTADMPQKANISQLNKKRKTILDRSLPKEEEEKVELVKKKVAHKGIFSQEPWGNFSFPNAEIEFLSKPQLDAERVYLSKDI